MKLFKSVQCLSVGKLLDDSSDFVDKHLRFIQNAIYASMGITVLMIGRRLRLVKQFRSIHEIPEIYITKQISLRGRVGDISHGRILHVQHIPVIRIPYLHESIRSEDTSASRNLLKLKLIGVSISETQHEKANIELEKLRNQTVWFKLLFCDSLDATSISEKDSPCLHCLISTQNSIFTSCINYRLVRMGLAQVRTLPGNLIHHRITNRLHKAQKKAIYWKRGMWQRSEIDKL